ncbi:MAG: GIY-YIG nuclease family protein [Ignavibacteria bacterium]|nr:GIY-YIG nuclease family protein [Ignavibacteria bacterium]
MIIKAYGLNWDPKLIYGYKGLVARKCFKGDVRNKDKHFEIDFWKTRGIYTLFRNFEIVYVGKVTDMNLGDRIRNHFNNIGDHWDTFSFFSFTKVNFATRNVSTVTDSFHSNRSTVIKTLEAILINTAEPYLNKQEARFPDAFRAIQYDYTNDKSITDIYKKLEKIEKKLFPSKRKNK